MSKETVKLGEIQGITVTAERSVVWASLLVWLVFALAGRRVWRLKPATAAAGGLMAAVLHVFSEIWHQMGHARAARKTGFPMTGIHLWTVLGTSVYPANEPSLPSDIHIQRSLGGPRASLLMAVATGGLALLARPMRSVVSMIATIMALDNLLVFTLGALLPLPLLETDGVTLIKYLRPSRRSIVLQE